MRQAEQVPLLAWGTVALLAFLPAIRGGNQLWITLGVSLGMWLLIAASLARTLWRGQLVIRWGPFDLALLGAVVWVAVSLFLPTSPPEAAFTFLVLLGCAGGVLLARHLALSDLALNLATGLCAIGMVVSLVGLLQLFGVVQQRWWDPPQFLAATFVNHNHFAAYLELLLPLAIALWLTAPVNPSRRFLIALSAAVMTIAFILTCSRGAWLSLALAAAIGSLFLLAKIQDSAWGMRHLISLIAVCGAMGFLISRPPILERLMTLLDVPNDPSWQTRQAIWQGAWALIGSQAWIGYGIGSFLTQFTRFRPEGLYWLIDYAHNEYLQLTAELGVIGLGWFVLLAALVGWRLIGLITLTQTSWKQGLALGALVGLLSLGIHSAIDFPWHIPAVAFTLACVVGLVMGIPFYADPRPLHEFRLTTTGWRRIAIGVVGLPVIAAAVISAARPSLGVIASDLAYQRGQLHQDAGNLEEAAATYRIAIEQAPRHINARRRLGETLTAQAWRLSGQAWKVSLEQAAETYRRILQEVPDDAQSSHALAKVLLALGDLDGALRWQEHAVQRDPNNPLYWRQWAEATLLVGDLDTATRAFQRAAHLGVLDERSKRRFELLNDPAYFVRLGFFALPLGRLRMAEASFRLAQRLEPDQPEAQVGLALCTARRGELEAGKRLMASVHDPSLRAKWFAGLAEWHLARRQWDEAQSALETSLTFDPANSFAWHLKFLLARRNGDDLLYVDALDRLLALNRPPVFIRSSQVNGPIVVWEPEWGSYAEGHKTQGGWAFATEGMIEQMVVLPPGEVTFAVTVRGTSANGIGARLVLFWNGRQLFETEVAGEDWLTYTVQSEVKPGEQMLAVAFTNGRVSPATREDRNLKIDRVTATFRPL